MKTKISKLLEKREFLTSSHVVLSENTCDVRTDSDLTLDTATTLLWRGRGRVREVLKVAIEVVKEGFKDSGSDEKRW